MQPTKQQMQLLNFILKFSTKHGYAPSYREMAKELDYASIATVALHVDSLIERGYLKKRFNEARSLEVVDKTELEIIRRAKNAALAASEDDIKALSVSLAMLGFYKASEIVSKKSIS